MKSLSRSEKIYQTVLAATTKLDPQNPELNIETSQINSIARQTGISPNNISMELNRLYKDGLVMRVRGRPVTYFSIAALEELLGEHLPTREFPSMDAFCEFLCPTDNPEPASLHDNYIDASVKSGFDFLIGNTHSLRPHIEQAKAAILYPPHGLDTLLTGPTGVGKSHFANAMFDSVKKCLRHFNSPAPQS